MDRETEEWWYRLHPTGHAADNGWDLDRTPEEARRTLVAMYGDPLDREDPGGPRLAGRHFADQDVRAFLEAELRAYRGAASEEEALERAEFSEEVQRLEERAVSNAVRAATAAGRRKP